MFPETPESLSKKRILLAIEEYMSRLVLFLDFLFRRVTGPPSASPVYQSVRMMLSEINKFECYIRFPRHMYATSFISKTSPTIRLFFPSVGGFPISFVVMFVIV